MEERKWILGDDLAACDNLLDGITFEEPNDQMFSFNSHEAVL